MPDSTDPFADENLPVPAPAVSLPAAPEPSAKFLDNEFVDAVESVYRAKAKVAIYEADVLCSQAMGTGNHSPWLVPAMAELDQAIKRLLELAEKRKQLNAGYWFYAVPAEVCPYTFKTRCVAAVTLGKR